MKLASYGGMKEELRRTKSRLNSQMRYRKRRKKLKMWTGDESSDKFVAWIVLRVALGVRETRGSVRGRTVAVLEASSSSVNVFGRQARE